MVKIKELNLEALLAPDKKFEKNKRLDLDKKVTVYYSDAISTTTIEKLYDELLTSIKFAKKEDIKFLRNDDDILKYLLYLIAKYFTNLEEALMGKDLYVNIDTFYQLYDKGFLSKILVTLDKDEVEKVQKVYTELAKSILNLDKEIDKSLNEDNSINNA